MHGAVDGASSRWELLTLGETARAVLPAAKKGVSDDDTSVLALDIDLTVDKPVQRGMIGGVDLPDLPPPPRLIAYSQGGFLVSFNIQYSDVEGYPGKVAPKSLTSSTEPDSMDLGTGANTPAPSGSPKPAFGGFGATTSGGFTSTTPAKPPAAPSAFGQASKPAFGSSAFGQSSFGSTTPATTPAKPAFGQTGFGSSTPPTTKPTGFGQTSSPSQPAFGTSGFGQTSKPAFGSTSFGQSSSPSTFGQSAFGQPNKAAAPAFGSSGFGQTSKPSTSGSAFGQSAFGQPVKPSATGPAFGQSAFGQAPKADSAAPSSSAFGQPAKPAATAFGSAASPSAGSAFGAFGTKTGSSPAFGFGSSTSGQTAKPAESKDNKPAATTPNLFGNSAFGTTFGASSGQSAFGAKPSSTPSTEGKTSFGGFGQKPDAPSPFGDSTASKAASPDDAPSPDKDDFGLGGFASALGVSSKPATVPGLADSPPGSPVLQGGKAGHVPGLEESPPGSPSLAPKPVPTSQPSTASSFIKPATGFSGATTGSFGNFGGAKSTSAFGSSSPAAFSAPAPKTSAFASASPTTGGSAFGQTSKPAAPAFGSSTFGQTTKPVTPTGSAFGQSSKPLGFGQPSTPKPAFGNISGGFGGFAQKGSTTPDGKPAASGGFAGFGAKTSGQGGFGALAGQSGSSIFGEKAAPPSAASTPVFGKKDESPVSAPKNQEKVKVEEEVAEPEEPATPPGYDVPELPKDSLVASKKPEGEETASAEPVKQEGESDAAASDQMKKAAAAKLAVDGPAPPEQNKGSRGEESKGEANEDKEAKDESQKERLTETAPLANLADAASAAAVPLPPIGSPGQEKVELGSPDSDEPVLVEHGDASPASAPEEPAADAGPTTNVDDEQYGNDEYDYDDESEQDEEAQSQVADAEQEASEDDGGEGASEGSAEGAETEEESEAEDEDAEEDVEEADQDQSGYSLEPEMSLIAESGELEEETDGDDGEADESAEQTRTTPKSPPAWFAKTSPVNFPVPSSPSPAQSSATESPLRHPSASKEVSTPSPAVGSQPIAAAQKLPASFNLKHTVRTSSPLGQPPQMATTSPDSSPAKPTPAPGFGGFGQAPESKPGSSLFGSGTKFGSTGGLGLGKPPIQDASSTAQTGPPSLFAGFGQASKPVEPKPVSTDEGEKPKTTAPAFPAPSSLFGSSSQAKPAAEDSVQNGGSLFGGFGQSTAATAPTTQPGSLFGGLNQGVASTGSVTQPSSLFSGFGQAKSQDQTKPAASSLFAGLNQQGQQQQAGTVKPPQPSTLTPSGLSLSSAPTSQPAPPPSVPAAAAKKTFTAPSRPPLPIAQSSKDDGKKTMSAVLERMIQALLADMQQVSTVPTCGRLGLTPQLKETFSSNARFHAEFTDAAFSSVPLEKIHEHKELPFSSLKQITSIIQDLSARMSQLKSVENGIEAKISDIQSSLLKSMLCRRRSGWLTLQRI